MYGFLGFSGNFYLTLAADLSEEPPPSRLGDDGWLTSLPFAFGVVACLAGGSLSDAIIRRWGKRWGRRLVGVAGLTLAGLAILAVPWVETRVTLGFLLALAFFGNDLAMAPAWAAAADIGERYTGISRGTMNMMASFMAAIEARWLGRLLGISTTSSCRSSSWPSATPWARRLDRRRRPKDAERAPLIEGLSDAISWRSPPAWNNDGGKAENATENVPMPKPTKRTEAARSSDALRDEWLSRLNDLVRKVKSWAEHSGWKTREITKSMKDSVLGEYRAPALLMQRETVEVILDPVARFVPGADGAVDLYLIPAYDDIASLYLTDGEWKLHYTFDDPRTAKKVREPDGMPLTKRTVVRVLEMIAAHAA